MGRRLSRALRGRRTRWLITGVPVAVLLAGSGAVYALTGAEPEGAGAANTVEVDRGEVATAVATTGTLAPAESRSLGFSIDGTVTEIAVRPGELVEAGDVLARIDDTDAQERVDDAEDELAEANAALAEAEQGEGEDSCQVADSGDGTGAVLVAAAGSASPTPTPTPSPSPSPGRSPSPSPTSPTQAPPSQTPTQAPPSPTSPAQAPPAGSPGAPQPSQPSGGDQPGGEGQGCAETEQPGGTTGGDAIFQAEQRVITAERELAEVEDDLEGTAITAVVAGKVLTVAGEVGSDVSGGGTFITLADVAGIQVEASFPEADAGALEVGQPAVVTLASHPGEEFAAVVVRVDPAGTVDGTMVRYGVVLAFEQAPADPLVGQSANVRVTTASVSDVLRVPATALRDDGTVLVDSPDGTVSRTVQVGLRGDQFVEITAGLREGERVVTAGS